MKDRRPLKRLGGIALLVACVIAVLYVLNPLRFPEPVIRWYLLHKAPLGSSYTDVVHFIGEHEWKFFAHAEGGFLDQRRPPSAAAETEYHGGLPYHVVGVKSIRANLGDYQGLPWEANVTVFWGFDEQDRLIDIWVWKTWNGL